MFSRPLDHTTVLYAQVQLELQTRRLGVDYVQIQPTAQCCVASLFFHPFLDPQIQACCFFSLSQCLARPGTPWTKTSLSHIAKGTRFQDHAHASTSSAKWKVMSGISVMRSSRRCFRFASVKLSGDTTGQDFFCASKSTIGSPTAWSFIVLRLALAIDPAHIAAWSSPITG